MNKNSLKCPLIAIGLYPYLVAIKDGGGTLKKASTDFNGLKTKCKDANSASLSDYLRWRYCQGCKIEEYFNYRLWERSWKSESPYLLENKRREILSRYNPDCLRSLLNSKIETAKIFQIQGGYFGRSVYVYDKTKSESKNRTEYDGFIRTCHGVCFCKDDHGLKGHGVKREIVNSDEQQDALFKRVKTGDLLLEESLMQHPIMAKLNPTSVNTLRVLSVSKNGNVHIAYCLIRMGRYGSDVDNAGSGGIFAPVDLNKSEICDYGRDYLLNVFPAHPDSQIGLCGYSLPIESETLKTTIEQLHGVLSKNGIDNCVAGWDIAIKPNGELALIEGNASADVRIAQIAFQKSFREVYELL